MKALITAAGLGTRLRPLTNTVPKALVDIGGKPLLEYHFDSFRKYGITDVCINTHYLPDQIENFVHAYTKKYPDFSVTISFEPELLGSAGTLKNMQNFFSDEENFIVVYSDNLTTINYELLINFHLQKQGVATIASYYEEHPETKGIMVVDDDKRIHRFIEKPRPEEVVSHIANGGIYVYNKKVFKYLAQMSEFPLDIGKNLLPKLLEKGEPLYTYEMTEFLLDVGTLETYTVANDTVKNLSF